MKIKYFVLALFLFTSLPLVAQENNGTNQTVQSTTEQNTTQTHTDELETSSIDTKKLEQLLLQKNTLDNELVDNNIWSKIYSNYHTFLGLKKQEIQLDKEIGQLSKIRKKTTEQKEALENAQNNKVTLLGKLQLLEEYEKDPFKKFLTPPNIDDIPHVGNPLAVIAALSYRQKLKSDEKEYSSRYTSLIHIMGKLKEKQIIIDKLLALDPQNREYLQAQKDNEDQIKTFMPVIEIFKTTENVYSKKVDEVKLNLENEVEKEIERTFSIGAIVLFFIILLFFIKYLVKKYMSDNERFYTINKALNITFVTILILTLLLAYIENVSYLVTILGFASAGIAIAMKDWFMSLMGWLTIVIGGAIHVGDRVKFVRDGVEYVGDIVDISLLRMTMHEDITLTTQMLNRRAGRIIFVPNNFIFTDMISNYSHAGLKTVWDGIDFLITFDSDMQKAAHIAKEIAKKYSKGYTDITRKQLNKLRSQYSVKNTNVEPRVFTLIEPYGMKISVWYLTNSYATLTLRSTISSEIIMRIQAEEKIHLAFPTQSVYVDKDVPKPVVVLDDTPVQGTLL